MADLNHSYGGDLAISASGDLAIVDRTVEGQQRIIRRLLTNPQDYIWSPQYGAGLPRFIGQPARLDAIGAVAQSNITRESVVQQNPPPSVTVSGQPDGSVFLNIRYVDQFSATSVLTLPLSES